MLSDNSVLQLTAIGSHWDEGWDIHKGIYLHHVLLTPTIRRTIMVTVASLPPIIIAMNGNNRPTLLQFCITDSKSLSIHIPILI
jgi:hypothetical protein